MNQLAENMRNLRIMKGFSLRYVADQLRCAPNTIANWEKGKTSPPADALILMTGVYGVRPEELFGWQPCAELEEFLQKKKPIMDEMERLQKERDAIDKKIRECAKLLNQGQ